MLFSFHQRNTRFIRFTPLFSFFSFKHHFSTPQKSTKTHIDTSSIPASGTTKSIFDKCSDLLVKKTEPSSTPRASSLQEILLSVAHVNPGITRKFWRKSGLEPRDVLDLLLGFESESGKLEIDVKKVGSLWGVFKWAEEQVRVFRHLDRSFRVMVTMLVRVGWFEEAESLVLAMEEEGVPLDDHEVFSKLIECYIGANKVYKGILMYDRMKLWKLVLSSSCHRVLIDSLVDAGEPRLAVRVCCDMLESGLAMGESKKTAYENVV